MTPLESLKALNDAAYAAVRAHKAVAMSHEDREALKRLARETDRLVDEYALPVQGGDG